MNTDWIDCVIYVCAAVGAGVIGILLGIVLVAAWDSRDGR